MSSPLQRLIHGDCVEVLRRINQPFIDALVTDPPYGLEFMGKDWDRLGGKAPEYTTGAGRASKPGIGERTTPWPLNRGWNELRCRKCGHLSHGGSPCVCAEPDFSQADDRWNQMQAWHEQWAREVLRVVKPGAYGVVFGGTRTYHRLACALEDVGWELRDCLAWIYGQGFPKSLDVAKAVAKQQPSAATEWEGWGTSLKPAWEPILLIRKPLIGTVAKNVLRHHTGALNIDGCRITTDETLVRRLGKTTTSASGWTSANRSEIAGKDGGRWPANLVLDEESAALLDTQVGGVSRFFYCAKATKKERDAGLGDQSNNHPTVKPVALMRWLARLVTPPGGVVLDPFTGSGTTGVACAYEELSFLGVEMNAEYVELAQQRVVAAASPTQR